MAEGILQDKAAKAGLEWRVESAGTNGYHVGEPPHHLGIKVAALNGIDISKQRSRRFVAEDFEKYDLLYAMAEDVLEDMERIGMNKFDRAKTDLFLNALYPGENRDVPDPWYGTEKDYHEVFSIIDEVCSSIVEKHKTRTVQL